MVYMILGTGFEESEAIVPCDLMRRAGIEVMLAGIDGLTIRSSHGVVVTADCRIDEVCLSKAEMIVLPGGLGGVRSIRESREAIRLIRDAAAAGIHIAAICAAPTVLAELGLLSNRRATCYPDMADQLTGAQPCVAQGVVMDGGVITGRAAGSSFDFGLALVTVLKDAETADKIAQSIHYQF